MKYRCMCCNLPQTKKGVMRRFLGCICMVCSYCGKRLAKKDQTYIDNLEIQNLELIKLLDEEN